MSGRIAALLFGSGLCALVYQVAWLRELRLVFGASTPASAAVLAVFMGGLGVGSAWLGKRADSAARPLALYARLELGIALTAALSPLLLWAARAVYIASGGTLSLGMGLGTALRLLLSALVLLPPTLLMGGTLPAAARAAERDDNGGRRATALLYGANTLGAVVGAALTTFVLLEVFGTRLSLWIGCLINALVALTARQLDRSWSAPAAEQAPVAADAAAVAPPWFVLGAAGATGLAFLQLELSWYRMLSPLLGGSTYTFGLILAVALAGIGVGGLLYTLRGAPPTLLSFAATCGLEALAVALPLALGDRVALLALFLRPFGATGFAGHAFGWLAVTTLCVLPAALVAGYQFPLLIGLLGRGRGGLGRHVGLAYAFNTAGSIAGSLATGFALLPAIGAVRNWALAAWTLCALGAAAVVVGRPSSRGAQPATLAIGLAAALLLAADGPSEVWRHSPIGTGRVDYVARYHTKNELRQWLRGQRYAVTWAADGRESSVALASTSDTAFLVNGKSDGSAVTDSTTQVMSGLLGALLQTEVRRALVIGLGTGSTAGWLARMPGVEVVDVIEIEPAIVEVARRLAPVNAGVLDNPKVRLHLADARELLLTSGDRYDLVFSEPSNPYRAGIASLFTHEFYQAVRQRLNPRGAFLQWVQGYEIDVQSVRTVYVTLAQTFATIESWRTDVDDLLLVARDESGPIDVDEVTRRLASEPFQSAAQSVWGHDSVETVLAHFVAGPELPRALAAGAPDLVNTDDRNLLEFAVARALGQKNRFSVEELRHLAAENGYGMMHVRGMVDAEAVEDARMSIGMLQNGTPAPSVPSGGEARRRYRALEAWGAGDARRALELWEGQSRAPRSRLELVVVADALARAGDAQRTRALLERLAKLQPTEALAIEAQLSFVLGDTAGAFDALQGAFGRYRTDPWPCRTLMQRTQQLLPELVARDPRLLDAALEILREPFAVDVQRQQRQLARFDLSMRHSDGTRCVEALAALEPNTPWQLGFLSARASCYERAGHPLAALARDELTLFSVDAGSDLARELVPAVMEAAR